MLALKVIDTTHSSINFQALRLDNRAIENNWAGKSQENEFANEVDLVCSGVLYKPRQQPVYGGQEQSIWTFHQGNSSFPYCRLEILQIETYRPLERNFKLAKNKKTSLIPKRAWALEIINGQTY